MIASIKHLIFSESRAVNHAMIHHGMIIYIANTSRARRGAMVPSVCVCVCVNQEPSKVIILTSQANRAPFWCVWCAKRVSACCASIKIQVKRISKAIAKVSGAEHVVASCVCVAAKVEGLQAAGQAAVLQ